jgi:hypothetical protein
LEVIKDTKAIEGEVDQECFLLKCSFCKNTKKNHGACIQCDWRDCTVSFHARCAVKHGVIKRWDQQCNSDDYKSFVFCKKHEAVALKEFKQKGEQALKGFRIEQPYKRS